MSEGLKQGVGRPYTTPISVADFTLALDRVSKPLSVFVAGPYIQNGDLPEGAAPISPGASLRVRVIGLVEERQHRVVLGEHRGVAEIGESRLRSKSSSALVEIKLTADSNCIIIIPDSPGSFCEIGLWAAKEELCRKMLILANNDYEKDTNYITTGVFRMATHHGAVLNWINFREADSADYIVRTFLEKMEDTALSRNILNGS